MARGDTDALDNRESRFRPTESSWDVKLYCGSRDVILLLTRFESRDGTGIYIHTCVCVYVLRQSRNGRRNRDFTKREM